MNALSIDEAALDVNTTKRLPGYKNQRHAIDAGRATMGPESRNGFEFEVFKLDGRWHWRAFETVRPDTASELKANGKPRMTKPADIKVHEEREAERAKAKGRLRGAPRKAKKVVSDPEAPVATPDPQNASGTIYGAGQPLVVNADPLDLPEFLKRPKPTPEGTEAVRKKLAKTVGPERTIKNPPDAKKGAAMAKKPHPADVRDAELAQQAVKFMASLFVNGGYDKLEAETLDEARRLGTDMVSRHNSSRRAMIYGILADGSSILIPDDKEAAMPNKTNGHARYDWKGAEEAAKKGKMPRAPDFSADTHKPYRKLLDEAVALAKAGDVKGLKALKVNPISSSPKAVDKFRNLALTALAAKA